MLAKAAPLLALVSGMDALLGLIGAYTGLLSPLVGFYLFAAGALLGGFLTVVVSLISLFRSRGGRDPEASRLAFAGLAVGVGLLLIVAAAGSPGSGLPAINDITTDLDDPPQFVAPNLVVEEYAGRDMSYPPEFVEQVRAAYPDLQTLRLDAPPEETYRRALAVADELGWEIVARDEERHSFNAKDETALFRFVDDIAVRVSWSGTGSEVDMRSKSREGKGDVGANAARIRRFFEALNDR